MPIVIDCLSLFLSFFLNSLIPGAPQAPLLSTLYNPATNKTTCASGKTVSIWHLLLEMSFKILWLYYLQIQAWNQSLKYYPIRNCLLTNCGKNWEIHMLTVQLSLWFYFYAFRRPDSKLRIIHSCCISLTKKSIHTSVNWFLQQCDMKKIYLLWRPSMISKDVMIHLSRHN